MTEIALGSIVKDPVSGVKGIAAQRVEFFGGNVQYAVQPQGDGVNYPDAYQIDHHMLEVIDDGVSARRTDPPEVPIELGQRVRDRATGFEGIAERKATYLNGCVWFLVLPQREKGGFFNEAPGGSWLEHVRLEVVDDGLNANKPRVVPERSPGGPSSRVRHQAAHR